MDGWMGGTAGLSIGHETHRARYLYSPWVARDFLPRHPDLRLVADYRCVSIDLSINQSIYQLIKQSIIALVCVDAFRLIALSIDSMCHWYVWLQSLGERG